MRQGKLSETELKRSVLKQMRRQREQLAAVPSVFDVPDHADAAMVQAEDALIFVSTNPALEGYAHKGRAACRLAANNLAASGALPAYYTCTFLFPPDTPEEEIRITAEEFAQEAAEQKAVVLCGHTERSDAVTRPVLSVSAAGRKNPAGSLKGASPGQDLVMTKAAGLEGTALLTEKFRNRLSRRFPSFLIRSALEFEELLSVLPEAQTACASGAGAMHDLSRGGVFGGLWEFAENCSTGLDVDLKKIPLRQETVEICDFLGCNPYELLSAGSLLISCENGEDMVQALEGAGTEAAVIGKLTDGKARILRNEDEVRYLDKPQQDAYFEAAAAPPQNA